MTDDSARGVEKLKKRAGWEYNMLPLNIYMLQRVHPTDGLNPFQKCGVCVDVNLQDAVSSPLAATQPYLLYMKRHGGNVVEVEHKRNTFFDCFKCATPSSRQHIYRMIRQMRLVWGNSFPSTSNVNTDSWCLPACLPATLWTGWTLPDESCLSNRYVEPILFGNEVYNYCN